MKVLYVVGSCLTKNTSANMSHNGYVQGFIENSCEVDILMAEDSWGAHDNALPIWKEAKYFAYPSIAFKDRIRKKIRGVATKTAEPSTCNETLNAEENQPTTITIKQRLRNFAKAAFYKLFPQDPLYPLEKTWLKRASKFSCTTEYDLVVSNSSPAASHKLVGILLKKKRIKCKRWIQIWEDPWFYDLYGGWVDAVRDEEHALLRDASEIYYVSPLTLTYQQKHFPDCADKMKHIPLPYLDFSNSDDSCLGEWSFGYFGDYYSHTRNLLPFYEALKSTGHCGNIYGDSDLVLKSTNHIQVNGRVTLDVLEKVQAKTRVLVHLCNLRGGQIPGKIYHYSATNKPILFIVDGTQDECKILRKYFAQFDRFYFCDNNVESIKETIKRICAENKTWQPLMDFAPKTVVGTLF